MKMLTDQQIDYHAARVIANDHDWQEHFSAIIAQAKLAYSIQQTAAECAKDAERYRWLRENGSSAIGPDRGLGPEWPYCAELDALCDAAIEAAKEK